STDFRSLVDAVRVRLLALGINPGGPQPSVQRYRPRRRRVVQTVWWHELLEWNASPRAYKTGLQPLELHLRDAIEAALQEGVVQDVLFADGSRDFEPLNLGFLWVNDDGPVSVEDEAAA